MTILRCNDGDRYEDEEEEEEEDQKEVHLPLMIIIVDFRSGANTSKEEEYWNPRWLKKATGAVKLAVMLNPLCIGHSSNLVSGEINR